MHCKDAVVIINTHLMNKNIGAARLCSKNNNYFGVGDGNFRSELILNNMPTPKPLLFKNLQYIITLHFQLVLKSTNRSQPDLFPMDMKAPIQAFLLSKHYQNSFHEPQEDQECV